MGFLRNLKLTKDAVVGGYGGPSPETLASLSPEQRAAYEAKMAEGAAVQEQAGASKRDVDAAHAAAVAQRPLRGPAGEWLYGPTAAPGLSPGQLSSMGPAALMAWQAQTTKEQLKSLRRNPLGRARPSPAPAGDMPTRGDRAELLAGELAAREAARAPYLADTRSPLAFTRIATRGRTQVEEVLAALAAGGLAARPELVFGLYRVPDRISPGTTGAEAGRVVEWDVVHAATAPLAPAPTAPEAHAFAGEELWVRRAAGEPSVLDEELALAYLDAAGIGPERCLGIARRLEIRHHAGSEGSGSHTLSHVTGVHVFHPAGPHGATLEGLRRDRPLVLDPGPPAGVHLELLNWAAVAAAVHPARHRAHPVPSPFAYLPGTPQELLRMYAEVVGLSPADCYAAAVTEDAARDLQGQESRAGGLLTLRTNDGDVLPCTDGKPRGRLAGGSLVVFAYRDRPEYAAGRARWAAYEREVLETTLANGTGARRPVEAPHLAGVPGGPRRVIRAAEKVADLTEAAHAPLDDLPPHRYCWPPAG